MKNLTTIIFLFILFFSIVVQVRAREQFFQVQSIDTMKYSRDIAGQKISDLSYDKDIDRQVKNIAETGATHVALGTPYDAKFIPFLKRWVSAARKYNLKVWFRGNLAGWENWFDYPDIDRETHIQNISKFILSNPNLFEDGDIFTSCPECENGGPGDPRFTGDVDGFRKFLVSEYQIVKNAFKTIDKDVTANYYSMNGDVARLIMDRETTSALDGIVTIDHYVGTPEQLMKDVEDLIEQSGGKIVLGEFGSPIPDIHGDMTQKEQAEWVREALKMIVTNPDVVGVNYWTNIGSSTQLWDEDYQPRLVKNVLTQCFNPINVSGVVTDDLERSLDAVVVKSHSRSTLSVGGKYSLPVMNGDSVLFSKKGFVSVSIKADGTEGENVVRNVTLTNDRPSFFYSILQSIIHFFKSKLP